MNRGRKSSQPHTAKVPREDAGSKANFVNRTLFQGENLNYLRLLNSDSVDLIATDPPFNKNRKFSATPNSLAKDASFIDRWKWDDDVQQAWLDELKTINRDRDMSLLKTIECVRAAHSDAMGAYLCYMAVRLLAMRRVLKPTGSIFLHCDPTASHYLKMIMDAIFGVKNFQNELVWTYTGGKDRGKGFQKKHDLILFYSKTKKFTWNPVYVPFAESTIKRFNKVDEKTGRRYKVNKLADGRITKTYMKEHGKYAPDYIHMNIIVKSHKEATGYPTQKPIALYKHIIEAASNKGDVVLDPFCGCATTLIASEMAERQWIGIDFWKDVYSVMEERIKKAGYLEGSDGVQELLIAQGKITHIKDTSEIESPYAGEPSAPYQESIVRHTYKKAPWEKLSDKQMVAYLSKAQTNKKTGWVVCAGCGREMEVEFMELDHIHPKSDNEIHNISNRILICKPCNGRKSNKWAFKGLWDANKEADWMHDETKAKWAKEQQKRCYERVRAEMQ